MNERKNDTVPEQRTGKAIDARGYLMLKDEDEARAFFKVVKNRLQNVNGWADLSGNLSASFQLVNANGMDVTRNIQEGDYLKIDIPGPGSKTGDGFDWVKIEHIESRSSRDSESFSFRVRPTGNPWNTKGENRNDIAHFYSWESTSTFAVSRKSCRVIASVRDRNTKPNKTVNNSSDRFRDSIVGTMGVLMFSKLQWQSLVDGLLGR